MVEVEEPFEGESLFAFGGDPESNDPLTFLPVRDLDKSESAASSRACSLLSRIAHGGDYDTLHHEAKRVGETVVALHEDAESRRNWPATVQAYHRAMKAWLSAFRSFDDRTSKWLSGRYGGKGSEIYKGFKAELSEQFDANFGYRVCCALRNASEHAGTVVNVVSARSDLDESGRLREWASLCVDGPRFAAAFPDTRAATREELKACSGLLDAVWLTNAAMVSCDFAYSWLLLALEEEADEAIRLVEGHHHEAMAALAAYGVTQGSAVFVPQSTFTSGVTDIGTITMNGSAMAEVEPVRELMGKARNIRRAAASLPMGPKDFYADESGTKGPPPGRPLT